MRIGKIRFGLSKKIITRMGDDKEIPYMIRWNLLSTPWFGIKVHKILISDEACNHDHPWSFVTFILKGGYFETTLNWQNKRSQFLFAGFNMPLGQKCQWVTWRGPGSILYRPAYMAHRLDLKKDKNGKPIPAITFVINFKRTREWGFLTPMGWVHWENYSSSNRCD